MLAGSGGGIDCGDGLSAQDVEKLAESSITNSLMKLFQDLASGEVSRLCCWDVEIAMDRRERILVDATNGIIVPSGIGGTTMGTFPFGFSFEDVSKQG